MSETPVIRFLPSPTGRIAFSTHGRGPTLICPAWWVSHVEKNWQDPAFRSFFATLAQHFTVVRYDRSGVGLSDPYVGEPRLDDELEVLDRLVTELGIGRCSLLGFSLGGPTAIAWAAQNPDQVERLVLYGTFSCGPAIATTETQEAMVGLVTAHWGMGSRTLADVFAPDATVAERDRLSRHQRDSANGATAGRLLEYAYGIDVSDRAAAVQAPTLILHRRGDRAIPFASGRDTAASIPGAIFVPIEGGTHLLWEGDTDLAPSILAFLQVGRVDPPREEACRLDRENRSLLIEGESSALTRLEFGVLLYLEENVGRVLSRDDFMREVWQQTHGGSNVVDAVIRTARKKLGDWSQSIETVKGHGYRFEGWRREA